MKKILEEILSTFRSTPGTISAKRVSGVFGWVILHLGFIYLCLKGQMNAEIVWGYVAGNTALLGIDSIMGRHRFSKDLGNDNENSEK